MEPASKQERGTEEPIQNLENPLRGMRSGDGIRSAAALQRHLYWAPPTQLSAAEKGGRGLGIEGEGETEAKVEMAFFSFLSFPGLNFAPFLFFPRLSLSCSSANGFEKEFFLLRSVCLIIDLLLSLPPLCL